LTTEATPDMIVGIGAFNVRRRSAKPHLH
jgi:hypothetical protein